MIEYLLILSEHEGIAIRAAHLPRPGDTLDVLKDYGARERIHFIVETVQYDVLVDDVPKDGVRGTTDTLPFVMGKVTARKVDGVWKSAIPQRCKARWRAGLIHNDGSAPDGIQCGLNEHDASVLHRFI